MDFFFKFLDFDCENSLNSGKCDTGNYSQNFLCTSTQIFFPTSMLCHLYMTEFSIYDRILKIQKKEYHYNSKQCKADEMEFLVAGIEATCRAQHDLILSSQ